MSSADPDRPDSADKVLGVVMPVLFFGFYAFIWVWKWTGGPWVGIGLGAAAVGAWLWWTAGTGKVAHDHALDGEVEVWRFGDLEIRLSPSELEVPGRLRTRRVSVHDLEAVVAMSGRLWGRRIDGELMDLGWIGEEEGMDAHVATLAEAVSLRRRGDARDKRAMEDALGPVATGLRRPGDRGDA